ncbi:unnamed protein product [marine sediment metagenome]|uniref:Uncharacterized protein n=1 Tax=marine sediment metagenome TaxID=412755 RepID=X1D838_9ZZZZ
MGYKDGKMNISDYENFKDYCKKTGMSPKLALDILLSEFLRGGKNGSEKKIEGIIKNRGF